MSLASYVREKRRELSLTQSQLAEQAGVSRNFVVDIEAGKSKNPGAGSLDHLAKALGLTIQNLIERGGPPPTAEHGTGPALHEPTRALLQFCASTEFARKVDQLAATTGRSQEPLGAQLRQLLRCLPAPSDGTLTKADYRAALAFVAALVDR